MKFTLAVCLTLIVYTNMRQEDKGTLNYLYLSTKKRPDPVMAAIYYIQ